MTQAKPSARGALLEQMRAHTAAILDADRRAHCPGKVSAPPDHRISVSGGVRRPTVFLWDEGVTCADAIAVAGGLRSGARTVSILRRAIGRADEHGPSSTRSIIVIELDSGGRSALHVRLRPGDEVRVDV